MADENIDEEMVEFKPENLNSDKSISRILF